jgi:hypothetical protein
MNWQLWKWLLALAVLATALLLYLAAQDDVPPWGMG